MRQVHLQHLVCPSCKVGLELLEIGDQQDDSILQGTLGCPTCEQTFPIVGAIPRFVARENYASSFGLEWTTHAVTQYDSYTGVNVSEKRFFEETQWPRNLEGERILEVGSGSGRFTEQAASTGALVISIDYSYAVEANYSSNGHRDNVLIVQASLYNMPLREAYFDKLFCIGVLQHTPDVKQAFMALPPYLKPGGRLVVDVYAKTVLTLFKTRYWIRPLTKRIAPATLYRGLKRYVEWMWPVANLINKIPYIGRQINRSLFVADYRGLYDLPDALLKEWAVLDSFDGLSAAYDSPQTLGTVRQWFAQANLVDIDVHYGYNGIEGRGTRPER